jgi:hypothetical protein
VNEGDKSKWLASHGIGGRAPRTGRPEFYDERVAPELFFEEEAEAFREFLSQKLKFRLVEAHVNGSGGGIRMYKRGDEARVRIYDNDEGGLVTLSPLAAIYLTRLRNELDD